MKKFLKENWLKLGVMILIVIIIFSFAYYLDQKNKVRLNVNNTNKNNILERDVPEVEVQEITKTEPSAEEPVIYHTKEELCDSLPHPDPPDKEIKGYAPLFKDPPVKHLRKYLDAFLSKDGSCQSADCFNDQLSAYDDLSKIDADYLRSKFIVLSIGGALYGGVEMQIIFEDKPDQTFYVWVYDYRNGKYDLRGFSKYDERGDGTPIDMQEVQKDSVNEICSNKFGI